METREYFEKVMQDYNQNRKGRSLRKYCKEEAVDYDWLIEFKKSYRSNQLQPDENKKLGEGEFIALTVEENFVPEKLNDINFGDYIEDILTRLMEGEQDFMSLIPCNYNSNKKVNVKAAFKPSWYLPERKITRQEYDDGSAMVNGKPMRLHGRAELRLRYLTSYNFILAAKFSPFNCHEFDRTSGEYFKGMLNGTISVKQFDEYMMVFPKRDF